MDDSELRQYLEALEKKLNETYVSVEKTRTYFLVIIVVSVIAFVLPLIGLLFAVPAFLSTYSAMTGL
jgi:hypothetical protein